MGAFATAALAAMTVASVRRRLRAGATSAGADDAVEGAVRLEDAAVDALKPPRGGAGCDGGFARLEFSALEDSALRSRLRADMKKGGKGPGRFWRVNRGFDST